jgi:hypothetical protein
MAAARAVRLQTLRETTGQARNRVYMADAVYEAIASPVGG